MKCIRSLLSVFLVSIFLAPMAIETEAQTSRVNLSDPRYMDKLNEQIQSAPNEAKGYQMRGALNLELQNYDEAIKDLSKAIELSPNDSRTYDQRAAAYAASSKWKAVIADCSKSIKLNAEDAAAYGNRGVAYLEIKQFSLAFKDLQKAIELQPTQASLYENIGEVCYNMKKYDKALEYFNKALTLGDNLGDTHYYRGMTYKALGRPSEANRELERARDLGYKPGEVLMTDK